MDLLSDLLDLDKLDSQGDARAKVRKYYEDSKLGYRLVHSKAGAVRMALNENGVFDRAGLRRTGGARPSALAARPNRARARERQRLQSGVALEAVSHV